MKIWRVLIRSFVAFVLVASLGASPAKPGWLGLGVNVQRGTGKTAPSWIYVQRLAPNGPAERAGIRPQDIITAIDGAVVRFVDNAEAIRYFATLAPGRTVTFSILRQHRDLTIRVRAIELPAEYRPLWAQSRRISKPLPPPP